MVSTKRIDNETRARVHYFHRVQGLSTRETAKLCQISSASVGRICQEKAKPTEEKVFRPRGRARKLTERQERQVIRALFKLRQTEGNFTTKRIMQLAGISETLVSTKTIHRILHRHGFHYLQARKKGLLTPKDLKERVKFAKRIRRDYTDALWTDEIAFYLDGTGFAHKRNPFEQARAPRARIWRKKSEGTTAGCVAKGRKEGTGGKMVRVIAAISYRKGVIICEPYEKMDGLHFSEFIAQNFSEMFERADRNGRLFLQDGCPCQNASVARTAWLNENAELFKIPARSPDLNPIENLFSQIGRKLRGDALSRKITSESFEEFKARVRDTLLSFPSNQIDKLILSMPDRIDAIIAGKGKRLKY